MEVYLAQQVWKQLQAKQDEGRRFQKYCPQHDKNGFSFKLLATVRSLLLFLKQAILTTNSK
ncbi:hypothetical protein ACULLB_03395 [Enterococcus gallinarum]